MPFLNQSPHQIHQELFTNVDAEGRLAALTGGAPQDGTQSQAQLLAQSGAQTAQFLRAEAAAGRSTGGSGTSPEPAGQGINPPAATAGSGAGAGAAGARQRVNAGAGDTGSGVGGGLAFFQLALAVDKGNGTYAASSTHFINFEMAPARRSSVYEKGGPQTPGAGSGLDSSFQLSLAKLKVPGSRPIFQSMGIAGETISFVGAMIGFDEYYGSEASPEFDNPDANNHRTKKENDPWYDPMVNAFGRAKQLLDLARRGSEVILRLGWDAHGEMTFENGVPVRGYLHKVSLAYSTAQRVYYQVVLEVTNREDLFKRTPEGSRFYKLPPKLVTALAPRPLAPGESPLTGRATEQFSNGDSTPGLLNQPPDVSVLQRSTTDKEATFGGDFWNGGYSQSVNELIAVYNKLPAKISLSDVAKADQAHRTILRVVDEHMVAYKEELAKDQDKLNFLLELKGEANKMIVAIKANQEGSRPLNQGSAVPAGSIAFGGRSYQFKSGSASQFKQGLATIYDRTRGVASTVLEGVTRPLSNLNSALFDRGEQQSSMLRFGELADAYAGQTKKVMTLTTAKSRLNGNAREASLALLASRANDIVRSYWFASSQAEANKVLEDMNNLISMFTNDIELGSNQQSSLITTEQMAALNLEEDNAQAKRISDSAAALKPQIAQGPTMSNVKLILPIA